MKGLTIGLTLLLAVGSVRARAETGAGILGGINIANLHQASSGFFFADYHGSDS